MCVAGHPQRAMQGFRLGPLAQQDSTGNLTHRDASVLCTCSLRVPQQVTCRRARRLGKLSEGFGTSTDALWPVELTVRYKDATGASWFSEIDKGPTFQVWLAINGEDQELVRLSWPLTLHAAACLFDAA